MASLVEDKFWKHMIWGLSSLVAIIDATLSVWSNGTRGILPAPFLVSGIFFCAVIIKLILRHLQYRRYQKNSTKLEKLLEEFEENQSNFLLSNLCINREFTTLCTECCHFNSELLSCSLNLHGRKIMIPIKGFPAKYCLYWNYTDNPFILKSVHTDELACKLK